MHGPWQTCTSLPRSWLLTVEKCNWCYPENGLIESFQMSPHLLICLDRFTISSRRRTTCLRKCGGRRSYEALRSYSKYRGIAESSWLEMTCAGKLQFSPHPICSLMSTWDTYVLVVGIFINTIVAVFYPFSNQAPGEKESNTIIQLSQVVRRVHETQTGIIAG